MQNDFPFRVFRQRFLSVSRCVIREILDRLKWATACAIGPGIGRNPETLAIIRKIIAGLQISSVIDADALFALAEDRQSLNILPKKCILTPHLGEFARLVDMDTEQVKDNRVELVREKAEEWNCVIILKGSPSLIASPEGMVYLNPSGNAGMATGGVGDVLTGHLAALLGMGMSTEDAAVTGAYLHGLAGDFAEAEKGTFGLSATDIIDKLTDVFKEFGC